VAWHGCVRKHCSNKYSLFAPLRNIWYKTDLDFDRVPGAINRVRTVSLSRSDVSHIKNIQIVGTKPLADKWCVEWSETMSRNKVSRIDEQ